MQNEKFDEILAPFIQLAHLFRIGDTHSIESTLHICSAFIAKYSVVFKNKQLLTELLAQINSAYQRHDYVALADIFEYEIVAYLKAELADIVASEE